MIVRLFIKFLLNADAGIDFGEEGAEERGHYGNKYNDNFLRV